MEPREELEGPFDSLGNLCAKLVFVIRGDGACLVLLLGCR
jgi:hypothetical protein